MSGNKGQWNFPRKAGKVGKKLEPQPPPSKAEPAQGVTHILYKNGDKDIPSQILDRNGDVCLGQCKVCGKTESELEQPCNQQPPT